MAKIAAAAPPAQKPTAVPPAKPNATPTAIKAVPEPTPKQRGPLRAVLVVVVLLAIAGAGAWYYFDRMAAPVADAPEKSVAKPTFLPLEPFTVNLAGDGGERYLQLGIVYQISSAEVAETMKTHMPILRNRLLLLLSAKHPADIATPEGKKALVHELVTAARESVPGTAPDKGIVDALLASFVVQ